MLYNNIMNKVWEWLFTKAIAADETYKDFTGWDVPGQAAGQAVGPLGQSDLSSLLATILERFFEIAGGLAFLALIVGAWQYLLAGGDETRAEAGKKTITWAIVGIVLALLFLVIVRAAMSIITGQPIF